MAEIVVPILVITLLIVLNGLFVAAEFAIVASRGPRLESLATDTGAAAASGAGGESWAFRRTRATLASPLSQDRYIAVAQLGITIATIGLGMYGEPAVAAWLYGPLERYLGTSRELAHTIGAVIAVLLLTYFHVVIGEMIPKALALQAPERTALRVARPMRIGGLLFYPLVTLLNGVGNALLRLLRIGNDGDSRIYSPSELTHLVQESHEQGAVSEEEERLIRNILEFGERRIRDVMVPRTRVEAVQSGSDREGLRGRLSRLRYSRYPIFGEDLDDVQGILHIKDFIDQDLSGEPFDLAAMLRPVPRVPETASVEVLLSTFKRLHVQMAVVVDEHGGTSGIVTLDDLLEEVVGEVASEPDVPERPEVEELGDGRFLVEGRMPLHHFNERFGVNLETSESVTVAGYVLERLQRVPVRGDEVETEGLLLRVEEMDGLAIKSLLLERIERSDAELRGTEQHGAEQAGTEQSGTDQSDTDQSDTDQSDTERTGTERPDNEQADKQ